MNAKAWRLYAAGDARLEDVELEGAGEDGVVVEIVTNTICLSDYKAVSLGTGHKRVPKDIASNPTMFGHEISGIVREVGADVWDSSEHSSDIWAGGCGRAIRGAWRNQRR